MRAFWDSRSVFINSFWDLSSCEVSAFWARSAEISDDVNMGSVDRCLPSSVGDRVSISVSFSNTECRREPARVVGSRKNLSKRTRSLEVTFNNRLIEKTIFVHQWSARLYWLFLNSHWRLVRWRTLIRHWTQLKFSFLTFQYLGLYLK